MSIAEIVELVSLIFTGIGFIVSLVAWIKTKITNLKEKKFIKFVEQKMVEAGSSNMTNEQKREYVLKEVGYYFNEDVKLITKAKSYIEECWEFAKSVIKK